MVGAVHRPPGRGDADERDRFRREREGLLAPSRSEGNTRLYTDGDLERLEVILKLTRELGVNLAGVEIILNMREKMAGMQQQIEEFVSTLNHEFTVRARRSVEETRNSLIPVIQMNSLASRESERKADARKRRK